MSVFVLLIFKLAGCVLHTYTVNKNGSKADHFMISHRSPLMPVITESNALLCTSLVNDGILYPISYIYPIGLGMSPALNDKYEFRNCAMKNSELYLPSISLGSYLL